MLALRLRSCSKNIPLARGYHRFATNCHKGSKMRTEFRLALVSGLLLATSYVSLTNNNLRSDSLPAQGAGSTDQKQLFSASTNSLSGISAQQNKQGIYLLSDAEVSRRLRQYEESYLVNRGKGVIRYDICQLPSNNPIEDDRSEKLVQVPVQDRENNNARVETDWHFWSIFDGHAGWNTSAKLRDSLLDYVVNELDQAYKVSDKNLRLIPSSETIDRAIKQGFLKLDDEIVNKNVQKLLENPSNKAGAAELLMPALSGSCALMSFYDTHSRNLKVAVTGDSRALLGSLDDHENKWTVRALSTDQTGSNPTEVAKLLSEHPNEPNVVRNGRVLGSLEPTRAFGDARYKWAKDIQTRVANQFFGRQLPANLKTPPYVTAEPVITTHEVSPAKHDFLVMASDGLYEMLTNEEIVGLVVRWMEKKKMVKPKKSFMDTLWPSSKDKLPLVEDVTDQSSKSKQRLQTRRKSNEVGFLLEDENVATHLIRNALSNGGSKEEVNMLVSIPSPLSRRYRDDLTVSVVFFGEGDKHEKYSSNSALEINQEATKGGLTMKAKL
ncbi:protein phophatase 2C family protein [Ogataea parapolymorpha DL-1]|uniref:Protein phophatase 2C family protein n=1 Tax=Ogataea parapolymorpha (strain ATCC 26012 / BCRC 20466 / JCM 22074 / NRRL Y-7560 / DL-1) TaxID=871575 RepID=W1QJL7_OGAPD|nr:protein phophatase 2C family protein [Ogataea parapolymorpha DL-1]ESX02893.1 protein phophatase 2C family protein [Ogataea parapolymorpha DL-1]